MTVMDVMTVKVSHDSHDLLFFIPTHTHQRHIHMNSLKSRYDNQIYTYLVFPGAALLQLYRLIHQKFHPHPYQKNKVENMNLIQIILDCSVCHRNLQSLLPTASKSSLLGWWNCNILTLFLFLFRVGMCKQVQKVPIEL